MNRKILIIVIGFIMVVIGYWYGDISDAGNNQSDLSIDKNTKVGGILTPFILNRLDGSPVTVGPLGKIIVIHFWDTWCLPCQEEMFALEGFSKDNQQKVDFHAVNFQEDYGKIWDFINKNKYTMSVLLDEDGELSKKFQVNIIPTTIIVNKHGMIKYRKAGAMTRDELEGIINSL